MNLRHVGVIKSEIYYDWVLVKFYFLTKLEILINLEKSGRVGIEVNYF